MGREKLISAVKLVCLEKDAGDLLHLEISEGEGKKGREVAMGRKRKISIEST